MNRLSTIFNLDPETAAALAGKYPDAVQGVPGTFDLSSNLNAELGAPRPMVEPPPPQVPEAAPPGGFRVLGAAPVADPQRAFKAAHPTDDMRMAAEKRMDDTPQGASGSDGFPTYRQPMGEAPVQQQGGPWQGVATPAHWTNSTRSGKVEHGIDPAAFKEPREYREAATNSGFLGAEATHRAELIDNNIEDQLAQVSAAADLKAQAIKVRITNERNAYVAQERDKFEQLAQMAQKEIRPNAFFENADGTSNDATRIGAALAIAMGQFGASLTGGQNAALQIVRDAINRNVEVQQANIAKARGAYDMKSGIYARNLEAIGDPERAALATKAQMMDAAKTMLSTQYAASRNEKSEAKFQGALQAMNKDRAAWMDEYAIKSADKATEELNEKYVPASVPGAGGQKGREALYVPTLNGYARDAETARKLNASGAMRTQITEDAHTIYRLLEEAKGLNTVTDYGRMEEIRSEIAARKHEILRRGTVLRGQGAMSEGDKTVSEIASSVQDVDPRGKTNAQIERMRKGLSKVATMHQQDHRLEGEANGIQLGREVYQAGPNGPTPVAKLAGHNKTVSKQTQNVDDLIEAPKGVEQ